MTHQYLNHLNGKPGIIINLTTSVSDMVVPGMSAYGGSKLAVNRFTQFVQAEYGEKGMRCLGLHPGGIASTEMGQAAPEWARGKLMDSVELAAGTVLYLSTEGAGYLDGRMVYADWNMEKVEKVKEEIVRRNLLVSKVDYGEMLRVDKIVGVDGERGLLN